MTARHDLTRALPTADPPRRVADLVGAEAPTLPLRDLPPPPRRRRWVLGLVAGALLMATLVVGSTAFRVWQVARVDDRQPVDAVIVLGAAQYDGEPSSIFAFRLRHAEALYEEGLAPRIVTT